MKTVYLNGEFLPVDQAKISPFDRGFLFADSVYEVTSVLDGRLVDFDAHMARLERSAKALSLNICLSKDKLRDIHIDLAARNGVTEGIIYLQLSRGAAPRDFLIDNRLEPTLFLFAEAKTLIDHPKAKTGIRVVSVPDERWGRCAVKTTQLLSQSLARSEAVNAGVDDAWFVRDGYVTEGTTNNAFILTADNKIITRSTSDNILAGITRQAILDCAEELGLAIETRAFSIEEAQSAKEAFISSASTFIWSVIEIDGQAIGDGTPGHVYQSLRSHYIKRARGKFRID